MPKASTVNFRRADKQRCLNCKYLVLAEWPWKVCDKGVLDYRGDIVRHNRDGFTQLDYVCDLWEQYFVTVPGGDSRDSGNSN